MTTRGEKLRTRRAQAKRRQPAAVQATPGPRRGEPVVKPEDRDGLLWLIKKGRLSRRRMEAAAVYRDCVRDVEGAGINSGLDFEVRTGSAPAQPSCALPSATAALKLYEMRSKVLRGHREARTVLDGVCGGGRTLREMAGGDWQRAKELEVMLRFALDLIAEFYWPEEAAA